MTSRRLATTIRRQFSLGKPTQPNRKTVRAILALIIPLCAVVAFLTWQNYHTRQQYLLDRHLCSAVKAGDLPSVRELLNQGADPNARELASPPPAGLVARIRQMFVGPPPDQPSLTVLHRAAYKGFDEAADLLLSSGAKVDSLYKGLTPLVLAGEYGRSHAVSQLLKAGADPNRRDSGGSVTLMWQVAGSCDVAAVRDMIDHGAKLEPQRGLLIGAATNPDPGVMALLLDRGLNSDFGKKTGWPLLYYAVVGGNPPVVKILLQRGANPNDWTRNDWTILQEALFARTHCPDTDKADEILRLLRSHCAK